jgi:hypothetical protein
LLASPELHAAMKIAEAAAHSARIDLLFLIWINVPEYVRCFLMIIS